MKYRMFIMLLAGISLSCFSVIDKEAQHTFANRSSAFSVTVFPFHVVVGDTIYSDRELQGLTADYLNEKGWTRAVTYYDDVEIPVVWGHNQAKMFRSSATRFAEKVISLDLDTDYALLVESLSIGTEDNVGGVHFYLVDRMGRVVAASLSNSHWESFTSVNPSSRRDAMKVAFNLFEALAPSY